MTVTRKTKQNSIKELVDATRKFMVLLEAQGEEEAVNDLGSAVTDLTKHPAASEESAAAVQLVLECFTGDHELIDYINKKPDLEHWSASEELFVVGTTVFNLAKRLGSRQA